MEAWKQKGTQNPGKYCGMPWRFLTLKFYWLFLCFYIILILSQVEYSAAAAKCLQAHVFDGDGDFQVAAGAGG